MPDKRDIAEIVALLQQAAPLIEKVKGNGVHLNFNEPVFIGMLSAEDAALIMEFFHGRRRQPRPNADAPQTHSEGLLQPHKSDKP